MHTERPPTLKELFDNATMDAITRVRALQDRVADLQAEYRPWHKVKYIASERGIDPKDAWFAVKLRRPWTELPFRQAGGNPFHWCGGNHLIEPLHRIDIAVGGGGASSLHAPDGVLSSPEHRARLQIRTMMDEAAESSIIEGAATTRKAAVEMLRSQRPPRSTGERMVVNNYLGMQFIKRKLREDLTPELLLELQGILTEGTLKDAGESRRWRRPDENVNVVDVRTEDVIHTPPHADELPERVRMLCGFANQRHEGSNFIHPIVKASILHFMMGYDHPFVDGNGRTARAVFYWAAIRAGYWPFEFMPISERIRAGASRYPQAYLDSELDEGDLTYFIVYKLDIIEQSLDLFARRLRREEEKIRQADLLIKVSKKLNLRQRLLLQHALRRPSTRYTRLSHKTSNGISLNTAATDLEGLVRLRLMAKISDGNELVYVPSPNLRARLAKHGM